MKHLFDLNTEQLIEIARHVEQNIREGLRAPDQEIHCLPTYIPNSDTPKTGRALVIDFGGTNVRAAVTSLQDGELLLEKGPAAKVIPVERGKSLAREKFLASLADLVVSLEPPPDLPVGYCFSYPAESTPDRDVRLLKWTKEIFVKDTVGEKMGSMLLNHLAGYSPPVPCSSVTVINDTVASLLAGTEIMQADGYIGLIVGTGSNLAALMDADMIPKLPESLHWQGSIPMNLESGNFVPPYLNEWDDQSNRQFDPD